MDLATHRTPSGIEKNTEFAVSETIFQGGRLQPLAFSWLPQLAMISKYVNTDSFWTKMGTKF
ncbi:6974_t:CDS:2 [Cetraspora pellucida]|uniref:6974_t:CDS:1 n=1 Tax=Cetraspora pellucida TaxID=1433469 RepID=A0A9N9EEE3_9GLOM|nr:6974_t:CDS:2 [Cetraspora pellucida]